MKKLIAIVMAFVLLTALTGCKVGDKTAVKPASMELTQSQLTAEEANVLKLLASSESNVFDFKVDDSVTNCRFERYELSGEGKWEPLGGGSFVLTDVTGRAAIVLDAQAGQVRMALQNEQGTSAIISQYYDSDDSFDGLTQTISYLAGVTSIKAGQEFPLAMQIVSSADEVQVQEDDFYNPEKLSEAGHEHVYAFTIAFISE